MIRNIKEKINLTDTFVLADFDKTLTTSQSPTTWGIISQGTLLPKDYEETCNNLYEKYAKYELDIHTPFKERCEKVAYWYQTHIDIAKEAKISKSLVDEILNTEKLMALRPGAKEFLEFTYKHNIPFIIVSAGIDYVIKVFLKNNNCDFPNIHIIANELEFKDGFINGFKNTLIHALNKDAPFVKKRINEIAPEKKVVVMLGDNLNDTLMIPENKKSVKIGFLNLHNLELQKAFYKQYDIVLLSKDSLEIIQTLFTKY